MTEEKVLQIDGAELPRRAEERLGESIGTARPPGTGEDKSRILHELRVHQIELERQNAELRQSRDEVGTVLERYVDFYDFAPVGFFTLDRKGTILGVNFAGADLIGIERFRLNGRCFEDFVVNAARPAFSALLEKVFTSPAKETCELPLREERISARLVHIEAKVAASGQECRIAILDITEFSKAHEEVRKLWRVVEQSPSAIVISDREGRIEYVNSSLTRLTGYESAELIGRNPEILTSDNTPTQQMRTLWDTIFAGAEWHGELMYRKKTGEPYWAAVSIAPVFGIDGGITHFVGIQDDITGRKQAEEELLFSRKRLRDLTAHLQKAREEERTKIAREIHDELGQVLATVQMGVSLLAEEYRDHYHLAKKISSFEEMLEGAIKTVQRISGELRPQMLDMLGLAKAIEWQAKDFQKKTGIVCNPVILLRQEHFEQAVVTAAFRIFQETLTNVIRHSMANRVDVTLEEKRGRLVMIIKDNGRGIAREDYENSHSLGILGMKERAFALEGRVTIFGSPEKGTIVITHIPIKPQTER